MGYRYIAIFTKNNVTHYAEIVLLKAKDDAFNKFIRIIKRAEI